MREAQRGLSFSKRLYLVISVPCGVAVNANESLSNMSVRTFACLAEHILQRGHDPLDP